MTLPRDLFWAIVPRFVQYQIHRHLNSEFLWPCWSWIAQSTYPKDNMTWVWLQCRPQIWMPRILILVWNVWVPRWHSLFKPGHVMIPMHYLQTFTACVTSLEDGPSCTTAQRLRLKTHSGVGDCITLMSNYLKLQKNNRYGLRRDWHHWIQWLGNTHFQTWVLQNASQHARKDSSVNTNTLVSNQSSTVCKTYKSWSCPDCCICLKHLTKFNCLFSNLAFSLHVMEPFVSPSFWKSG